MSQENYPNKNEYPNPNLTPDQMRIWDEICDILLKVNNVKYTDKYALIRKFEFSTVAKSFDLRRFILWNKIIGSSPVTIHLDGSRTNINLFDIPLTEEDKEREKLKDVKDQSEGYIERFIRNDINNLNK